MARKPEDILKALFAKTDVFKERDQYKVAARAADLNSMSKYCLEHATCGHLQDDRFSVISEMIQKPQTFVDAEATFGEIMKGITDFAPFFDGRTDVKEQHILSMHALKPDAETARVAGVILAEYYRAGLLKNMALEADPGSVLSIKTLPLSPAQDHRRAALRDSVITVQNALADHVREDGPRLPLNRGAAMLLLMRDEISPSMRDMTGSKILSADIKVGYSLIKGECEIMKTAFAPKAE